MGVKLERFIQPRGKPGLSRVSMRQSGARPSPVQTPTISPFRGPSEIASTLISSTAPAIEQVENRIALAEKNSKLTELTTSFREDQTILKKELDESPFKFNGEQDFYVRLDEIEESYLSFNLIPSVPLSLRDLKERGR